MVNGNSSTINDHIPNAFKLITVDGIGFTASIGVVNRESLVRHIS